MKYLFVSLLIGTGAFVAGRTTAPAQQERQYHTVIPAHLVNQYLFLVNGQLEQLSAKDYKELQDLVPPQIYQQYREYSRQDSTLAAQQKSLKDSTKNKKP